MLLYEQTRSVIDIYKGEQTQCSKASGMNLQMIIILI